MGISGDANRISMISDEQMHEPNTGRTKSTQIGGVQLISIAHLEMSNRFINGSPTNCVFPRLVITYENSFCWPCIDSEYPVHDTYKENLASYAKVQKSLLLQSAHFGECFAVYLRACEGLSIIYM